MTTYSDTKEFLETSINSHITKEEFIKLIETLHFTHVRVCNLSFITEFAIKYDENGQPFVQTYSYDINIT